MAEPEDLAQRFLALWQQYLTALAADPATVELWQKWLSLCPAPAGDAAAAPRSAFGAAAAAGASGERDAVVAELARRLPG